MDLVRKASHKMLSLINVCNRYVAEIDFKRPESPFEPHTNLLVLPLVVVKKGFSASFRIQFQLYAVCGRWLRWRVRRLLGI